MNEVEPTSAEQSTRWQDVLAPYSSPSPARSLLSLGTSVGPYLALLVAIYAASRVSIVLALLLAVPAAGFLVRTFIVFHDCAHGSLFRSRRANRSLGALLGVVLWMPFGCWQHKHAVHHATSGDLDRRGVGDVHTLFGISSRRATRSAEAPGTTKMRCYEGART